MKTEHASGLAIGIGGVAGLRPMTALAAMAWAVRRGRIQTEPSPIVVWMLSAATSKRIAQLAISELIVDKLPFTPSRLKPKPLTLRIVTGTICGAALYSTAKRSIADGAVLGGAGAIAGSVAGYQIRKRLRRDMPDLAVALLEDAVAVGGGALVMTLAGPTA